MKNVFKILTLVLIITLGLFALTACGEQQIVEKKDYDIPADLEISLNIYDGNTLLGTITKDALNGVAQEKITMTTKNSMGTEKTVTYIAYKLSDVAAKVENLTVPAFTSLKTVATDEYKNDFELSDFNALYITIGTEKDGAFEKDSSSPRLITDKESSSSNSVTKLLSKIVLNPVKFGLLVKMTQGEKINNIAIPSSVTPIEYEYTKNDVTTVYKGYALFDIINSMEKIKQDQTVLKLVGDYSKVGFECSDDEQSASNLDRVYTKAEVESSENYIYIVADNAESRCYSDLADTDPATYRNRLKHIITVVIYNLDDSVNCTFEFTWNIPEV